MKAMTPPESEYAPGSAFGGSALPSNAPKYQRDLTDYLLIVRDRIWYFIVVFFVIFISTAIYTFQSTTLYRASVKLKLLRETPKILPVNDVEYSMIRNAEDFNTSLEVFRSMHIVSAVADRLSDEDRRRLMAPYNGLGWNQVTVEEVLFRNRSIAAAGSSLIVFGYYTHPDANIAAIIANYFADEYINYTARESIAATMSATEDLRVRAGNQKNHVERLRAEMEEYLKRNDSASLKPEENIHLQQLLRISSQLSDDKQRLDLAAAQWNVVETARKNGVSLRTVPFIAGQELIVELFLKKAGQEIELAGLRSRYRDKHPTLINAASAYQQTLKEIDEATQYAVEQARKNLEQAQHNYAQVQERLALKRKELTAINELAIRYRTLEDDLRINNDLYLAMMSHLQMAETNMNLAGTQIRIIDRAQPPTIPYSPDVTMNLAIGALLGIACGLAVVFGITFLNERIQSPRDVEELVGLQLLGVLPRSKDLRLASHTRGAALKPDRRITDAFRVIHSAIRIAEQEKEAKVVLMASTYPGEGRSFVSARLAATFAIHGERTLLIDADLRMPSAERHLGLEGGNGLVRHLAGECTLDEALTKCLPNLDVLPAGKAVANSTEVLNSREFRGILQKLSHRYDRIFIDTPPLAVFSDALNLLPCADEVVYVIKSNTVSSKIISANIRRLKNSSVPVIGAILNEISQSAAKYYYTSHYDKYYHKYYNADDSANIRVSHMPAGATAEDSAS